MATALDIITDALRRIGVLAEGEVPSAAQAADALSDLNGLIDQHAAERLMIYTTTRTPFDITANEPEYQFGLTGHRQEYEDGFDSTWSGAPPEWTGSGTVTNDTATFQAGGHSVRLAVNSSTSYIYRDFLVFSGTAATLSLYVQTVLVNPEGDVRVQCIETQNYLNSSGDWTSVQSNVFSATTDSWELKTISFDVEEQSVVGAATATLRVTFSVDDAAIAEAFFDTFSLANAVNVINIPRPVYLDHVNLLDTSVNPDQEIPLTPLTDDAWALLPLKDQTSTWPTSYYYNPTDPYGTITFWPVPTGSNLQAVVYVPSPMTQFAAVTDTFTAPPGYRRMLTTNLALELCPSYDRQPSPLLVQQARDSMAVVKAANFRMADLSFDRGALCGAGRPWFNIRTGR